MLSQLSWTGGYYANLPVRLDPLAANNNRRRFLLGHPPVGLWELDVHVSSGRLRIVGVVLLFRHAGEEIIETEDPEKQFPTQDGVSCDENT